MSEKIIGRLDPYKDTLRIVPYEVPEPTPYQPDRFRVGATIEIFKVVGVFSEQQLREIGEKLRNDMSCRFIYLDRGEPERRFSLAEVVGQISGVTFLDDLRVLHIVGHTLPRFRCKGACEDVYPRLSTQRNVDDVLALAAALVFPAVYFSGMGERVVDAFGISSIRSFTFMQLYLSFEAATAATVVPAELPR